MYTSSQNKVIRLSVTRTLREHIRIKAQVCPHKIPSVRVLARERKIDIIVIIRSKYCVLYTEFVFIYFLFLIGSSFIIFPKDEQHEGTVE